MVYSTFEASGIMTTENTLKPPKVIKLMGNKASSPLRIMPWLLCLQVQLHPEVLEYPTDLTQ